MTGFRFFIICMTFVLISPTLGSCTTIEGRSPAASFKSIETDLSHLFAGPAWQIVSAKEIAQFEDLWFISDVHGHRDVLHNLLHKSGLITSDGQWAKQKQMLIFNGDNIDGGSESAEIINDIVQFENDATANQSRVLPLLGNHEAKFLSDPEPKNLTKETLASLIRVLHPTTGTLTVADVKASAFYQEIRKMQLGALIGSWLVAHSGLLEANPNTHDIDALTTALGDSWADSTHVEKAFALLADESPNNKLGCLLARHQWFEKHHDEMNAVLQSLGLNGLIVGHEPELLAEPSAIAIEKQGWFLKIDSGIKNGHSGEILHCKVAKILADDQSLKMFDLATATAQCTRMGSDGIELPLIVK